jgi:5'-nucleotidase
MKRSFLVFCITLLSFVLVVPTGAQRTGTYRILVGNDDGVRAPGLAAVAEALQAVGEVTIVAPADNQSGKGHSITITEPIFREDLTLPNGLKAIGLTATPASTINVALRNIVKPAPDLVVSGINFGYNLAYSAYLSGTVGGAREAVMHGVPAVAASLAEAGAPRGFAAAAQQVLRVVRQVKDRGLPQHTFLNVNIPPVPAAGYKGYMVTTQALTRGGEESFAEMTHPSGRTVYWNVYREGGTAAQGTDIWAVQNGYVSITPMHVGEYDEKLASTMKDWFK